MASTASEFVELMTAEDFVELDKLREIARQGVPDDVRGDVWKYLLGVAPADKSKEMSTFKDKENEYGSFQVELMDTSITARLKAEIKRYQPDEKIFRDHETAKGMERVVSAYINSHRGVQYTPAMVHICGPIVFSLKHEWEIYYCFEAIMSQLDNYQSLQDPGEMLARFNTLFRTALPELYNYFEEEEIDPGEWALPWLSFLLSRELPLPCVLRLWDTYLSLTERFEIHSFVCLAILKKFKDELEDLEHSEILGFLRRLPSVDMDQIIAEAYNLRDDVSIYHA